MLKFAQRGAARAFTARTMSTQTTVASTEASTSAATATKAGETNLLTDNIWLVNSTTAAERVVGFRWTPGLWARAKVESAETNKALFERVKAADITPRDIVNVGGVALTMWAAFVVGEMIGKWKIFGHRNKEPHHGHGMWTDTPTHH